MRKRETTRGKFVNRVCESMKEGWCCCATVEKWKVMKTALCESARHILGYELRKHPDWFMESEIELRPLFHREK